MVGPCEFCKHYAVIGAPKAIIDELNQFRKDTMIIPAKQGCRSSVIFNNFKTSILKSSVRHLCVFDDDVFEVDPKELNECFERIGD